MALAIQSIIIHAVNRVIRDNLTLARWWWMQETIILREVQNVGVFSVCITLYLFTLNFTTHFVPVSWRPSSIPFCRAAAFVTTLCVLFQLIYKFVEQQGFSTRSLKNFVISFHGKKCQLTHFLGFYSPINFYLNEDFPSCALRPVFIFNYQLKHSKTTKKKTNYIWWVILSFNKVLIHIIRSTLLTIKLCFFFFQNGSSSWLHRVGRDLKDHLLPSPFPCVGTLFTKS